MFEAGLNYIEKRIFRRLNAELPVELEQSGSQVSAQTRNISCGGLFLSLDPETIDENQDLNLVIHLPNQKNPVKLVGSVKRSDANGVALEFQGLYNDNILAIERFVKSNLN